MFLDAKLKSYIRIYEFMQVDLGLSGGDLWVYAFIFSFYISGKECIASRAYMVKRLHLSASTVDNALKRLKSAHLIRIGEQNGRRAYIIDEGELRERCFPSATAPKKSTIPPVEKSAPDPAKAEADTASTGENPDTESNYLESEWYKKWYADFAKEAMAGSPWNNIRVK